MVIISTSNLKKEATKLFQSDNCKLLDKNLVEH